MKIILHGGPFDGLVDDVPMPEPSEFYDRIDVEGWVHWYELEFVPRNSAEPVQYKYKGIPPVGKFTYH